MKKNNNCKLVSGLAQKTNSCSKNVALSAQCDRRQRESEIVRARYKDTIEIHSKQNHLSACSITFRHANTLNFCDEWIFQNATFTII